MSYVAIATAIKNLVDEVTELLVVYEKEPPELLQFPCATVSSIEHENVAQDTAANRRRYSHMVRLYHKQDSANTVETILRDLADKVIAKLEANVDLQGSCDYSTPNRGTWRNAEREVPVKVVEITVDAYKRVNR
jgi:hypothetical protein